MSAELSVALLSGAVALVSAGLAFRGQMTSTRLAAEFERESARLSDELARLREAEQRRLDAEQATARYREPLARAAYDLQSRLYNLLQRGLMAAHFDRGDERERAYVVDNTAFLIAQYFAWTEIVRTDIQFIDLLEDDQTRRLARLQDEIHTLFQTDRYGRGFRVFAGEQRAIGERMVRTGPRGLECAGYAAYLDQQAAAPDRLIEALTTDVRGLSREPSAARPRLVALQHALIDLLAFLDPAYVRFPEDRRSKVPKAG
jgi:hypothetical protein